MNTLIGIDDVRRAAGVIAGQVQRTPAARSLTLSQVTGADVVVKFENLQFTASFKERGALNKLRGLTADQAARGVIAMSAGNHAQGVARHAALIGIPATIVMPSFTPFVKVRHTRNFGARVLLEGETLSEAADAAHARARAENLTFVHPYDDPAIIAGQGTIALELLADFPDLDDIIVPVGGGGLIAGIAVAARALRPGIRIFGVEASLYPSMQVALNGRAAPTGGATIADGIAVKQPGRLPLEIIRQHVADILLVDETTLEQAVVMFLEIEKTVAEGAGAAALAALIARPDLFRGRKVGVILSGGNIDSRLLASIIMRGLVRARRVVKLRVEITDAPGTLSRVSGLIGAAGGNIIEVYHQRLFGSVPAKSADLDLVLETRDAAHVDEILASLAREGHQARLLLD